MNYGLYLLQTFWQRVARNKMFLLMLGGAIGTYLRYLIGTWVGTQTWGREFPYGTLIINVSGSFILAVAFVIIKERLPPEHDYLFLLIGTGFCGGFTTFSTFEWETYQLARLHSWSLALANVLGSVVAGFLGVVLAILMVNWVFPEAPR